MNFTGQMATLKGLKENPRDWVPAGVPLVSMMNIERRKGKDVPVIKKSIVELDSYSFKVYQQFRDHWAKNDCFRCPGPIQFDGKFKNVSNYLVRELDPKEFISDNENVDLLKHQYDFRSLKNMSDLEIERTKNFSIMPSIFEKGEFNVKSIQNAEFDNIELCEKIIDQFPLTMAHKKNLKFIELCNSHQNLTKTEQLGVRFRKNIKIGVSFNGRQAPGGNNIIDGLLRFSEKHKATLIGFLGGTQGLFEQNYVEIEEEYFKLFRNQGGFNFLGRTSDKIRSNSELQKAMQTCLDLKLDGLILIGGSYTISDAMGVTEYFLKQNVPTCVIAVPTGVDGNLEHPLLESMVGFDTASKVYSQLIGNNMIDAASAKKYWYFMRLMGRAESHLVLESALQTHPNCVLISEECRAQDQSLSDVVNQIADIIVERAQHKKNFGTVLIPEGLLAHLPFMKRAIDEINNLFASKKNLQEQEELARELMNSPEAMKKFLTPWNSAFLQSLPDFTRRQLLLEREASGGGVQLSQIETEKLLSFMVDQELKKRKEKGMYKGNFSCVTHFFGYQGRCALPSIFDCSLASSFGYTAAVLIAFGLTGYLASIRGVLNRPEDWIPVAIPIVSLLRRNKLDSNKIGVESSGVDLKGKVFEALKNSRKNWILEDNYTNPGPIQFKGFDYVNKKTEITQKETILLLKKFNLLCDEIKSVCQFGVEDDVLRISINTLDSLSQTINLLKKSLKK